MSEHISKGRMERSAAIEELKILFGSVQSGVLTDFRGLKVSQITELRRRFRAQQVTYRVLKNNLVKIALRGTPLQGLTPMLEGPTGFAVSKADPVAPAKVAMEFAKDNEALKVKGGFVGAQILDPAAVGELSKLPGLDGLRSQILSAINAPVQQLLGVFNAIPQKFLGVLEAQAQKLGSNA